VYTGWKSTQSPRIVDGIVLTASGLVSCDPLPLSGDGDVLSSEITGKYVVK
jgi:hypothetical protein